MLRLMWIDWTRITSLIGPTSQIRLYNKGRGVMEGGRGTLEVSGT